MWLGLALLISMFGCQSDREVNIRDEYEFTPESAGGTQNQVQANTSENKKENTAVSANPTPTVEDKNKTESIYTDLTSGKMQNHRIKSRRRRKLSRRVFGH